jgi:hypothetical protein
MKKSRKYSKADEIKVFLVIKRKERQSGYSNRKTDVIEHWVIA